MCPVLSAATPNKNTENKNTKTKQTIGGNDNEAFSIFYDATIEKYAGSDINARLHQTRTIVHCFLLY